MKPTKRKAFNFLRSYFDILNELENDSDKLDFLLAVINKQFLDEDPKDLKFIPKLCYESQRHAIEKSVKGWKLANKINLKGDPTPPLGGDPKGDPTPPLKEEQEKEEEKEEYLYREKEFLADWKNLREMLLKKPTNIERLNGIELSRFNEVVKTRSKDDICNALQALFRQEVIKYSSMQSRPKHFLEHFETYLTAYNERDTKLWGSKPKIHAL